MGSNSMQQQQQHLCREFYVRCPTITSRFFPLFTSCYRQTAKGVQIASMLEESATPSTAEGRNQPVRFHDGWLLINERHLRINDLLHRVVGSRKEGRMSKTSILPLVSSQSVVVICVVRFGSWGICEWPTRFYVLYIVSVSVLSLELIASQLFCAVLVFTGHLTTINLVD